MYDINKMKLQYIDLHVQQLQVRLTPLRLGRGGGGGGGGVFFSFYVFFFNLSCGPSL